ncbi:hypothetical protein, variant [Puccinia triticina 1-1 BBBD Race 1]|uniref:Potassium uptake protein n=2 Tax=Puccinia triticina TaxID=208348 RepID=A0A180GAR4_PUCT1|nr:uncharacterized protein PtA15_3A862 [Puccinia triticina]OAV89538.1 hypothetical protein PTTG_04106 [Puccinia triticina 1-1 BBBD Race 1]OAV89539.1 hypothetical protein, variant [Puccinia triticina 1-1 BBBD Race 1]WAQ83491.1 hypothetical protein PtA15_3A862 [Puccinia triticina]
MSKIFARSSTWTESLDQRYRQAKPPLVVTAFAAIGIIYGDIGTSPLYVMNGIFPSTGPAPSAEDAMGAISAIIWTLTIVPLIKYSLIALEFGTGEGEGGPFALFAQLYPAEKEGAELALPSIHSIGGHFTAGATTFLARPMVKPIIKIITLFAVALIMSDGILTPAVSVTSAVSGIAIPVPSLKGTDITGISIAILIAIFFSQRFGTQKLALSFAPIVSIWLMIISGTGIFNITLHPGVFRALDPSRAVMYFVRVKSISPLSGILLSITGVEALFANLGQFSKGAIRLSFLSAVYPALILAYLGQGAVLITQGPEVVTNIFYRSIPGGQGGALWWITWSFALLAAIVASQAMITASFSLIQQMVGLKSFPPVRIVHTSDSSRGQIYAPVVNFLLLLGTVGVTAGFGADEGLNSAYGFAVAGVLITTTFLMTMVMIHVKGLPVWLSLLFFGLAGFIDAIFFASALQKIPHGAWFTLTLGCLIGLFLLFWTWAKGLEDAFDAAHRIKLGQLLIKHSSDQLTLSGDHPLKSANSEQQMRGGGGVYRYPNENDALQEYPSSPVTPTHNPSEILIAPMHISDLALHEEPEEMKSDEIMEEKQETIHLPVTGDEQTNSHEQKITIHEPNHPRSSSHNVASYPPVQAIHQITKHLTTSQHSPRYARRQNTLDNTEITLNPVYSPDVKLSGPLPRLECFSFFHHLGEGIGAPHSFSALLRHQPALPRVVVFLSIRVVGVPHLQEEDKYLIDKLRTLSGFYLMTYRVGYRDPLDLRGLTKPTLERIVELERGIVPIGSNKALEDEIYKITKAANNTNHILPHYHCTSKPLPADKSSNLFAKFFHSIRSYLLEEIYRRVSQNFPETSNYVVDESKVLRIGVNALI